MMQNVTIGVFASSLIDLPRLLAAIGFISGQEMVYLKRRPLIMYNKHDENE